VASKDFGVSPIDDTGVDTVAGHPICSG
jgi:hypothetical protein